MKVHYRDQTLAKTEQIKTINKLLNFNLQCL